jgi:hypothetical protein
VPRVAIRNVTMPIAAAAVITADRRETVDVDQSISGRILGYGTVLIRGIGSSWEPLSRIAAPLQ